MDRSREDGSMRGSPAGRLPAGDIRAAAIPEGIARTMAAEGGRVTFARFMELALTHPTDGYYNRAERLLGPRGHFSTAPYLSALFKRAVGRLLTELVDASLAAGAHGASGTAAAGAAGDVAQLPVAVVELGGGEGDLAKSVLEGWQETRPDLRERLVYGIVETGDGLRARQREALSRVMDQGWDVRWTRDLTEVASATRPCVIVGNEFVDALPVHLVSVEGQRPLEAWVALDPDSSQGLRQFWDEVSAEAEAELHVLFGAADVGVLRLLSRDGTVEVRPAMGALMRQIAAVMPAGCLLTIDYGQWFVRPGPAEDAACGCDLRRGLAYGRTLRGYFRHQLVTDPYSRVGRQDLTADVDFGALDLHGRQTGFETVLFTTVAGLLLADEGEQELAALRAQVVEADIGALEADREASVLEGLLDEQGLGGAFKVMLQVRD
jgi:SAM-dependent MidA family methyltransferase